VVVSRSRMGRFLHIAGAMLGLACAAAPLSAFAQDDDAPSKDGEGFGTYTPTAAKPQTRTFTLPECLALADRNFPNIWAARARLAVGHAQLDEATWAPYWGWSANFRTGVLPTIGGTAFYTSQGVNFLSTTTLAQTQPFLGFDFNGGIPLYTFGKITS